MYAGLPKFVPVNLKDIEASGFQEGEEVSLASLKKKGLINPSGRERRLPLKVIKNDWIYILFNTSRGMKQRFAFRFILRFMAM